MIDGSEKRNRQLAFELQNSHVCEKRSKRRWSYKVRVTVYNYYKHLESLQKRVHKSDWKPCQTLFLSLWPQ